MHGNGSLPPVGMTKQEVTPTASYNFETEPLKDSNEFLTLQARKAGHTEICWMPTNSSCGELGPSSRQSSITSRTRFIKVSRFLAWVWQPAKAGTVPT